MAQPPRSAAGATTVTVDRAALRALKSELAQERDGARRLQRELVQEVEVARKAAELTVDARAEREEYRRVLAAAVANEKSAADALEEIRAELEQADERLRASERSRGEAEGRSAELERLLQRSREEYEREFERVNDRAWADAESKGRELQRLQHERGLALGQVRELLLRVPAQAPQSARIAAVRARVCLGSALFTLALFLIFFAPFAQVVFGGGEATWPALAVGLSAWGLFWMELTLLALTLGLTTLALRGLRRVERASRAAVEQATREGGAVDNAPAPEPQGDVSGNRVGASSPV